MTNVIHAVQAIVDPRRVVRTPLELVEESVANQCSPILVRYVGESWALRLRDGDHLPVLAELPKERSVRRLPDYLIFSAPREAPTRSDSVCLQVLVCELKSSAAGAAEALPQVQLGKLVVEYLVRLAVHSLGASDFPKIWICGLIASAQLPANLIAKGKTRPGKVEPPNFHDKLSCMRIYMVTGGSELRLESIY